MQSKHVQSSDLKVRSQGHKMIPLFVPLDALRPARQYCLQQDLPPFAIAQVNTYIFPCSQMRKKQLLYRTSINTWKTLRPSPSSDFDSARRAHGLQGGARLYRSRDRRRSPYSIPYAIRQQNPASLSSMYCRKTR